MAKFNKDIGKLFAWKEFSNSINTINKNSVFENSYRIVTPISLNGSGNSINNCLIYTSGNVKISNNAKKENIEYKSPKWEDRKLFIPSEKSHLLKVNNSIGRIGLIEINKN